MRSKVKTAVLSVLLCGAMMVPVTAAEAERPATLSAGYSGSTYVDQDGTLWAWGDGYMAVPGRIREGMECTESAVPGYPAMLVRTDGTMLFFEDGLFEGAGVPVTEQTRKVYNDYWGQCCYLLDRDGVLWGWGTNHFGTLTAGGVKLGETTNELTPLLPQVADFVVLRDTALALKTDGTLWTWGNDAFGKLGTREKGDVKNEVGEPIRNFPIQMMTGVERIALGVNTAMAVKTDGTLWAWGLQEVGLMTDTQCDRTDEYDQRYADHPVQVMEDVLDVATGHGTTYILKNDHSLWSCGDNSFGEAGVGNTETVVVPTKIMEEVRQVAAGECFALAEKEDGSLWGWGYNGNGQLGIDYVGDGESITGPYQTTPQQIIFPEVTPITGTAYATTQTVLVNGEPVIFETYAIRNKEGNDTNYVKLRDLAYVLNGTSAQFDVSWDGSVNLLTGTAYTPNGTEMSTPYSGDRTYVLSTTIDTHVDGVGQPLTALLLQDDEGNGYSYYQLRSLASRLGFTVDWSAEKGIFIETE